MVKFKDTFFCIYEVLFLSGIYISSAELIIKCHGLTLYILDSLQFSLPLTLIDCSVFDCLV